MSNECTMNSLLQCLQSIKTKLQLTVKMNNVYIDTSWHQMVNPLISFDMKMWFPMESMCMYSMYLLIGYAYYVLLHLCVIIYLAY